MIKKDILKNLVYSRFDVPFMEPEKLLKEHETYFRTNEFFERGKRYFATRTDFLADQLDKQKPVFAVNLFYGTVGYLLMGHKLHSRTAKPIVEYLEGLRGPQGGFLPIGQKYIRKFPKLGKARNNPMVPEIYSAYYTFFLLKLLGKNFDQGELEDMLSWVLAHRKPSGLIYNAEYSNTREERRMEAEITAQLYFATELISLARSLLPDYNLDDVLVKAMGWVQSKYASLRTIAGRYFAIKTFYRISPDELCNLGTNETLGFVSDRKSPDQDGYYDYRLQDKFDESMTSRARTELDKVSSHVFSTYYGFTVLTYLKNLCDSKVSFDHTAVRSLAKKAANPDNGFGMKVMVKDFQEPYGPSSTELETLLILLIPLIGKDDKTA
jgi:hypothetical protein